MISKARRTYPLEIIIIFYNVSIVFFFYSSFLAYLRLSLRNVWIFFVHATLIREAINPVNLTDGRAIKRLKKRFMRCDSFPEHRVRELALRDVSMALVSSGGFPALSAGSGSSLQVLSGSWWPISPLRRRRMLPLDLDLRRRFPLLTSHSIINNTLLVRKWQALINPVYHWLLSEDNRRELTVY